MNKSLATLNAFSEGRALLAQPMADVSNTLARAAFLRDASRKLVVLGTGGSGMSGRLLAALSREVSHSVEVFDNLGDKEIADIKALCAREDAHFLLISKSGTTLETLVFADVLQSAGALARTSVITVPNGNVLHQFAGVHGLHTTVHENDLGGRFSVFSAVGLLPAAFAGVDIKELLRGANAITLAEIETHVATQKALIERGISTHVLMVYAKALMPFANWWRQCFSESLGKDGKGAGAVIALGPKDQHSQLQLYMEGPNHHYFTFMQAQEQIQATLSTNALLPELRVASVSQVVSAMCNGTVDALRQSGKSVRTIEVQELTAFKLGQLLQSTMVEIALLGLALGINPFTQPAVEQGKALTRKYLREQQG